MGEQKPSIGRIVLYKLTADDAAQINRRRTNGHSIGERMKATPAEWPSGAQAHIGNEVHEGDVFPMMITRVWGDTPTSAVNGQAFLDGTDVFWVTSASVGDQTHQWNWPPRV